MSNEPCQHNLDAIALIDCELRHDEAGWTAILTTYDTPEAFVNLVDHLARIAAPEIDEHHGQHARCLLESLRRDEYRRHGIDCEDICFVEGGPS